MWVGDPKAPRNPRHGLWSKEFVLSELKTSELGITKICKMYAPSTDKWRALYNDTVRWRTEDPEFAMAVEENRARTDSKKREHPSGGRPRLDQDPEHHDWQLRFCEELLNTKSRKKASLVTPYDEDTIYRMLHEKYKEYDANFAEMVHLVEMRMVARAEEIIWKAMEDATSPKDRAWIAKEILKVRERGKWGDKLDVSVNTTIRHMLPGERQKLMASMVDDQNKFFQNHEQKALPSEITESIPMDFGSMTRRERESVIEGELVVASHE